MHFFPRRESKNCSRERSCQNPCQLLKQVFQRVVIPRGATHLPGIFSRHHLVIRRERTERYVGLHVDLEGKVDEHDQKHTLPSPQRSWQAPVNRCMRQHNDVVSVETSGGTQANLRDTSPIHQVDFGSSIAQENAMESECSELAEKKGFSVHAKIGTVGDLNSVVSSTFDVGSLEQHSNSLPDAVFGLQQRERRRC